MILKKGLYCVYCLLIAVFFIAGGLAGPVAFLYFIKVGLFDGGEFWPTLFDALKLFFAGFVIGIIGAIMSVFSKELKRDLWVCE